MALAHASQKAAVGTAVLNNMNNDNKEALIGLLHELATLDQGELQSRFDLRCFGKMQDLVRHWIKGGEVPAQLSKLEFSDWVYALRSNEREWSRRLGETILAAEDLVALGEVLPAISTFESFIELCPWLPFTEIAHAEIRRLEQDRKGES